MRILIVVENLPVPFDRRVWQEACALRDAGHEITVICPQMRGYTLPEEVLEGIQIYRHWISGEAGTLRGFIAEYVSALWGEFGCAIKAWRRGGFDVIHLCNPPDLLFIIALPFKWFAGVKVIYDVHDLWPEMFEAKFGKRGLMYWAVRIAERCTLALADVVIATNQSVLKAVKQRGKLADAQAYVVRTAPNRMKTDAERDETLRGGKQYLVGYIGVMGSADGVDYLIRAADYIVKTRQRQDVQFLLMGSGPEHAELLALRDQLGLQDCIQMPGRVSDEFLCRGLRSIDLGVACDPINTYNDHCTMNKVLEYMAFAKPIVMFGTVEGRYSAGDGAVYVMQNSAELLGDAILALLDNEAQRATLAAAGHARLTQELQWERSVAQLITAYQSACAS